MKKVCSIKGCGVKHEAKGYCQKHYRRFKVHGDATVSMFYAKCKMVTCSKTATRYGFCPKHVWYNVTRDKYLRRAYGITLEDYERMLAEQNSSCAICKRHMLEVKSMRHIQSLFVDHCHTTGKVRGLLCNNCNRTVGFLGDTLEGAMRFVKYLENGFDSKDGRAV